jgi:hypothetical protein
MKLPAANGRVSQLKPRVPDVIAVDVRYFGENSCDLVDKYMSINPCWNDNDFNGLPKIAACAEPCPDDRTGSIQDQEKEDRKEVNTNEGEAYKDSVLELLDFYNYEES